MKSTLYILYGLIFMFSIDLCAQTGKIIGKIIKPNEKPAEFVNVGLKNYPLGSTTNEAGEYEILNILPGKYTLLVSYVGYESNEQEVEVFPNNTTIVQDIKIIERLEKLDEVVIVDKASKYNKSKSSSSLRLTSQIIEVPQNIQIVTGDVIKDQQVISMSDGLIKNVSGLVRSEHWGDLYTNISTRGSQIHAFRNGFNVVNSYWGPLTEDMSFVENIEFVKGPAGFMLSSGDPSGMYNVVTKKPTGQSKGEASFTLGSFNLYRTTLDLEGKLTENGKLLFRMNGAAQFKKSHRANEHNNRYSFAPVLVYNIDENTKLTFEYNYQHADMSNVGSYYVFSPEGLATLPRNFTLLPSGMPDTKINDHSAYVTLNHNFRKNLSITAQVAHFAYKQVGSSMWPNSVNPNGKMIRDISIWDAKSNMTMGQFFMNGEFKTGSISHKTLSGIDIASKDYLADWGQYHSLDSVGAEFDPLNPNLGIPVNGFPNFDRTSSLKQRAEIAGGKQDQNYTSIYIQDEIGFFENKLRLTIAGRFTTLSQSYYGGDPIKAKHFTPRVGLSGSVHKSMSVYALYDQSFIPQSGIMANGGKVQPITGNNIEIGIKKDWFEGKWNTTLTVYRILKNNELTADPNSPPISGISIEIGQKRSQGIEFDLKGEIVKGLNLIANYAFTDSRVSRVSDGVTSIEVGDVVPGFSKHILNTWLTFQVQEGVMKGFGLSAGTTWLGGRATYWDIAPDPSKEMKNYFKLDAGLFWEKESLKITANIFNLLDTYLYSGSYYQWLNAYNWQTEPGRNFRLSLNYKF